MASERGCHFESAVENCLADMPDAAGRDDEAVADVGREVVASSRSVAI